jgi:2-polyprenyl-3-methyl-5-hydroxy-6-metoxy-1,4-benzoquinol methylase
MSLLQIMDHEHVYVGKDLEAMSFAENYHRWIMEIFGPYLGKRVVEVGAGTGSFSELILEHDLESLALVEPSADMHRLLSERIGRMPVQSRLKTYNSIFTAVANQIKELDEPDSIIYVNVLEHIQDDEAELRSIQSTLSAGGRVFIFVPALRQLFGSVDERIGHFRRYVKDELVEKCSQSGFRVIKCGYFDFFGIAPWWFKHCLLRSPNLGSGSVKIYDKFIVPAARVIESALPPPVGKNIFLIAEKV